MNFKKLGARKFSRLALFIASTPGRNYIDPWLTHANLFILLRKRVAFDLVAKISRRQQQLTTHNDDYRWQ